MIDFKVTPEDGSLIDEMDLTAHHNASGGLDLRRLSNLPAADFSHDISGIRNHVDVQTGELKGQFRPRCGYRDAGRLQGGALEPEGGAA